MATYHLSVKRGKKGSSVRHFDYLTRSSRALATGKGDDLVQVKVGNLPNWATNSPRLFWTAADRFERSNGNTYTEYEIALPRELDARRREMLVDALALELAGHKPFVAAVHSPRAAIADGEQPHLHLMFSERVSDGLERSAEQHFKRYNAASPSIGGCKKDACAIHPVQMKEIFLKQRARVAEIQNEHLHNAGVDVRVDHRSLADRGIDREPERHIGPARVRALTKSELATIAASRSRSPMATSNSPTYGHSNSPRQDGLNYESAGAVTRRAAASRSR